jgi:lipopolysaccharide transport system permease protein
LLERPKDPLTLHFDNQESELTFTENPPAFENDYRPSFQGGGAPGHSEIPQRPLVVIKSGRKWIGLNLGELWAHRDLFYFLIWRDVKVRYKQTVLGVIWAILQPLLTMTVFTFLFGKLARVPSDGIPYPIFVFAGLLPWNFFAAAVDSSSNSLVGNSALITKVYFPRLVIPSAAVGAALVDFGIAFVILVLMGAHYKMGLSVGMLMLIPLIVSMVLFAMGIGIQMSALNVKYRDVRHALPFLINVWMYATPVIYPVSFIPDRLRWILVLNPLAGIIEGFRCAIFNRSFIWGHLAASLAIVVAVLFYSLYSFRRMEKSFADII